jgi:predicted transcriptional regulator
MRTTVEISDEQRARLLDLAARRGDKGFSGVVREAIDQYLANVGGRKEAVERALAARGRLSGRDGEELEAAVREIRTRWR